MRLIRGRADTPAADREVTDQLISAVGETGESVLRVWQPPRQVAFGRRDAHRAGYDEARQYLSEREIPYVERTTGGHAVFFSGTTVSFLRATPVEDGRSSITARYETTIETVRGALSGLGVEASEGEPYGPFFPGTPSLSADAKIVGLAQRVRRDTAVISGIVVVQDHEEINEVLDPVYRALEIPFERTATGSIAKAGGESDPERVCRELERALSVGEVSVERVGIS
jgi:octanoyl-[GcvH]:protein N-octanoyltransferase